MRRTPIGIALALAALACEGPAGPSGQQGIAGPQGEPGNDGVVGPTGPTGENGEDGENGQNGDPGRDGRSPIFTAPGLALQVTEATLATDGTLSVAFDLTDGAGKPLDREGLFTNGAVTLRFIAAWLDVDDRGRPRQYTAYTTRQATGNGMTVTQAATDGTGTYEELEPGRYRYTFSSKYANADRTKTHAIAITATRPVEGETAVVNGVYRFVPAGGTPMQREVVTDDACNTCHQGLEAHGGSRQAVELCITCHSPQTVDPDSGNTVDFSVMIHKIHRGHDLPSVAAGGSYQIIGFNNSVHDYSDIAFPQNIAKCDTCHQGANADLWSTRPTQTACFSCHDDVTFQDPPPAGMRLHGGGAQPDDAMCTVCHPATGSIAPIVESHLTGLLDPTAPTLMVEIQSVTNTAPGQQPEVTFRVREGGQPRDIIARPLGTLRATVAGPNVDFSNYYQVTMQGAGTTGVLSAVDAPNGIFSFVFPTTAAIPANATGSYTLGIEANFTPAGGVRAVAPGPVFAFTVTDLAVTPRRTIVDNNKCENCHETLAGHGGGRRGAQYCTTCHHPGNANEERAARFENRTIEIETVDFKRMIHKIHAGDELSRTYILGGFPAPSAANPAGTPINFAEVRYPAPLAKCDTCHANDSNRLPLAEGVRPSTLEIRTCTEDPAADTNDLCETAFWQRTEILMPPTTSVCTSCHDTPDVMAHAELNTTGAGIEACATCHGPGSIYDADIFHD